MPGTRAARAYVGRDGVPGALCVDHGCALRKPDEGGRLPLFPETSAAYYLHRKAQQRFRWLRFRRLLGRHWWWGGARREVSLRRERRRALARPAWGIINLHAWATALSSLLLPLRRLVGGRGELDAAAV